MEIQVRKCDITRLGVDAIVNASKNSLLNGDGVNGAIHHRAGPELLEACRALNGCETGQAKITKGFKLPAKYVIHTVGPVFGENDGSDEDLLRLCYKNCLKLAVEYHLKTIAFPCISTGIFNYPQEDAAEIAVDAIEDFIQTDSSLEKIIFVTFTLEDLSFYRQLL